MSSESPASGASLPAKLYFRIGEVAGLVGVEPHVLRYWEREFRSIRPQKSTKGQRIYSRKDVENLLRVRDLLYRDGFTIAGAKKRMKRGATDDVAAAAEREEPAPDTDPELAAIDAEEEEAAPDSRVAGGTVREKLSALRSEVEAFLEELTPAEAPQPKQHQRRG
jgi:DNA-binding transcriptional MerR regulator